MSPPAETSTGGLRNNSSAVVGTGRFDRRTTGLEPGHRHPERRAGHVVEPHLVEEVHRLRVAAVLTADAQFQAGPCRATLLGRDPDQPADPVPVDRLERADAEDAQLKVAPE